MREFLIVDDNISLAENLAEIIADADVGKAVLAASGAQALLLAAHTRFDAMVSDVQMPNMSGVELFQRMRLLDPGLPAVLMTANNTGDELVSARYEGILCILPKPVPIARLLDLLAHAQPWSWRVPEPDVLPTWPDARRNRQPISRYGCSGFAPPGDRSATAT